MKKAANGSMVMGTIGQLVIVVLVLPYILVVLAEPLGGASGAVDMLLGLLSEIKCMDIWLDMLSLLVDGLKSTEAVIMTEMIVEMIVSAIVESAILGFCVDFFKKSLCTGWFGLPILPTVGGVLTGGVLVSFSNHLGGQGLTATVFLIMFGIEIFSVFRDKKSILAEIVGKFYEMAISLYSGMYIAAVLCILNGTIREFSKAWVLILEIMVPLIILLLVDYFVLTPKNQRR